MKMTDLLKILLVLYVLFCCLSLGAQVNDYRLEASERTKLTITTYDPNVWNYNLYKIPVGTTGPYLFMDTLGTTDFSATGDGLPIGFNFIFDKDTFDRFALSSQGFIRLGKSGVPFTVLQDTTLGGVFNATNSTEKANILSFLSRSVSSFSGYNFIAAGFYTHEDLPGERMLKITLSIGIDQNRRLDLNIFLYQATNAITYHYQLRYPLATQEVAVGLRGNQANNHYSNLHFRKVVSGQNTWLTSDTSDGSHFCDIDTSCHAYSLYSAPVYIGKPIAFDFYPTRWLAPGCTEAYIVDPYKGLSGIVSIYGGYYAWLRGRTDANRNLTIQWAPKGHPMMYDIYLDTDNPPTARIASDLTDTRYQLPLLAPNTKYYLRIVPHTPTEYAVGCHVDSFTTTAVLDQCPFSPATFPNLYQLTRKVVFGDINVTVPSTGPYPFQYPDTAPYITGLKRDSTYNYTVTTAPGMDRRPQVIYIDYNQNGVFEYPDEQVLADRAMPGVTTAYPIHIPKTAKLGKTVMQVQHVWDFNGPTMPCLGSGSQYYVTILPESRCATLAMNPVATPAVCPGDSGTIALNPSGGTGTLTVYWADDTSNHSVTRNLAPGWDYAAWVVDSIGCTFEKDFMVLGHGPRAKGPDTLRTGICAGDTLVYNGTPLTLAGTYTDTLTGAQGCDSLAVMVLEVLPRASTTMQAQICQGGSYMFGGQSIDVAGVYRDTLTAGNGCDSVITLGLQVLPTLATQVTDTICPGDTLYFGGSAITGGGTYADTLTAQGGCDSIVTLSLAVYPEPLPGIVSGGGNMLATGTFDGYQWYFNGTALQGETQGSINALEKGDYTVGVTDANGCTATSAPYHHIPVGVQTVGPLDVNVFPNPNNGNFAVVVPLGGTLRLYTAIGDLLMETWIAAGESTISAEALPSGMYLLSFTCSRGTAYKRVTVAR